MTTTVFTIGHSRHSIERFTSLLLGHAIEQIVDVRSHPSSRWAPHFGRTELSARGVDYVFLGDPLGGRPDDRTFYREDGTVDYALRAMAPDFQEGIRQLVALARGRRTAIMCAEEDPACCHRRLLVAPALARLGAVVVHVRGDGRLEPEPRVTAVAATQLDLFGGRS